MQNGEQSGQMGLYRPDLEHESCGVGFVARLDGHKNHEIIHQGLEILKKLSHRGAVGADSETGDGAGILIQIPDKFFRKQALKSGFVLPDAGGYGVGMIFMPKEPHAQYYCEGVLERLAAEMGLSVLGWREVPTVENACGQSARGTCPTVCQVFVDGKGKTGLELERALFVLRRRVEKGILGSGRPYTEMFYVCSLSASVVIYKGQFLAHQIEDFFPELRDEDMESALAAVHQRYSTNTFPSWKLAHPYRYLAHNGEINTIRGNQQWFKARESLLGSVWNGYETNDITPVMQPGCSDSGNLDNALEFLVLSGYPLVHAMRMLIPEAWRQNPDLRDEDKGFYSYTETQMEPWDGPAAVIFTNGTQVGATLDRNGLRPARYVITRDQQVVLASEAGVLNISEDRILKRGKLGPGQMILADLESGTVVDSPAILDELSKGYDYAGWMAASLQTPGQSEAPAPMGELERAACQKVFGYTEETLKRVLAPLLTEGHEAMSSMGNDAPLAVLSQQPKRLFDYFRQLFAQVTNPPIDPIREKRVTSLHQQLGGPASMLKPDPWENRQSFIELNGPVIGPETLAWLSRSGAKELQAILLPMVFEADTGQKGLQHAADVLKNRAEEAVRQGYRVLILTDCPCDRFHAPVPSLLAVSAVHQHLLDCGVRMSVDLVVESGEAQDPFHAALLIGFGATAVCPWLALESLRAMGEEGLYTDPMGWEQVRDKALAAYEDGVLRIISKMGISTLKSFCGARIFESIGLGEKLVRDYFPGLMNRLPSVELDILTEEILKHHRNGHDPASRSETLPIGGTVHWRKDTERHLMDPESITWLQQACRTGDEALYRKYADRINVPGDAPVTLRNLLKFRKVTPIPLDQVEPEEKLLRRFATGAMSFGSLSKEMHETLAVAMNRIGGRSNSGEGGEAPERFKRPASGDYNGSVIKQIAAARFGVTTEYLVHAEELQIKAAQGAKPGEGGHLPGEKVTAEIGRVRHSLPGITLISPPPHHDIYSIEDLEQLIFDLKNVNPQARISVKLVSEIGVGTVAAGVAKGNADVILISGHDGGTGAAPLTSIKTAGIPWELGLAEAHQTLLLNNLRGRVTLQTDGQLRTGRDVAVATLLGAEEFAFATAPLIVCGCIQMRKCHENTCPVGVATQDPELRKNFQGKPEHVIQYFRFIIAELREIMASLGFATLDEMVGRCDLLESGTGSYTGKIGNLDLSAILTRPELPQRFAVRKVESQPTQTEYVLDRQLIRELPALLSGKGGTESRVIKNTDRSVGAMLSGELVRRYGGDLADHAVEIQFRGSAGQSFGAFLPKGVTFRLWGEANDYLGKSLSGGRIALSFPENCGLKPEENIIAGNTLLYGATSGEVFISGRAGERFAVRNSGAIAVVEGLGDHGCEYMTGGQVAVLGTVGWNFAAGMSGGVAYVYDEDGRLESRINRQMVTIQGLDERSETELLDLLTRHWNATDSAKARWMLDNWKQAQNRFARIISPAYAAVLEAASAVKRIKEVS